MPNKSIMQAYYFNPSQKLTEIARALGISKQRVSKVLIRHGIRTRTGEKSICPDCGGKKSTEARTCLDCHRDRHTVRLICLSCLNEFIIPRWKYNRGLRIGYKNFYCSRACFIEMLKGNRLQS